MTARRRILWLLLAAVLIAVVGFYTVWFQTERRVLRSAVLTRLERSIAADSQFSGAAVRQKGDAIVVLAPDTLAAPNKAALEQLVSRQSKPLEVKILYLPR
jgi:hypothetical protein